MDGFHFHSRLRVRWSEVDAQGIVYNAHWLTYLDIAFADYLRAGVRVLEPGTAATVMATTTLTWRAPARYADELQVFVRVSDIGRSSMRAQFVVCRDEDVLLEAQTVYVYVGDGTTARPVPDAWRTSIGSFESGDSLPSAGT
jgi:acyl-CoA thioester hydrolase